MHPFGLTNLVNNYALHLNTHKHKYVAETYAVSSKIMQVVRMLRYYIRYYTDISASENFVLLCVHIWIIT